MRIAARLAVGIALVAGLGTVEPAAQPASAAAPPPAGLAGRLLKQTDLPPNYEPGSADLYRNFVDPLFGTGGNCRLPIVFPAAGRPTRTVNTTFKTDDLYGLQVETLTEVLAEPGPDAARAAVAAATVLPRRCPVIETPGLTLTLTSKPLSRLGDRSAAVKVHIGVKAASTPNAYVDAADAEIAVVARRGMLAAVILIGYFPEHDADLTTITRRAVGRLEPGR